MSTSMTSELTWVDRPTCAGLWLIECDHSGEREVIEWDAEDIACIPGDIGVRYARVVPFSAVQKAREEEREACAKMCEELEDHSWERGYKNDAVLFAQCVNRIRSRPAREGEGGK